MCELEREDEWRVMGGEIMEVILRCLKMIFPDGLGRRSLRKKNRMYLGKESSRKAESSLLETKKKVIISKHMKRFR